MSVQTRSSRLCGVCLSAAMLLSALPARADEVTETIDEALQQFRQGNLVEAAGNLDYAAQLIRQQRGSRLQALLPEPLPGWTAGDPSSQAAGAVVFGGMTSAERSYAKADASVTIPIVTDAPMLRGMLAMFAYPMLPTPDGAKLQKIKGRRARVIYDADAQRGEVTVIVAARFLVTVAGRGVARHDLVDYASAIDFARLETL